MVRKSCSSDMKRLTRQITAKRTFQHDEDSDELPQSPSENRAPRKILKAKAKRRHVTMSLCQAVFSAFAGIKNGEWTIATKDNDLIEIQKHDETKKATPSVFAKKDIKYSQEIFREAYFLRRPEGNDKVSLLEKNKLRQEGYIAMLSKINSEKYQQFMALRSVCRCIQNGKFCRCSALDKRWSSNSWGLPDDNPGKALYLIASLIQHSCDPNAVYAFTTNGTIIVAAARDIKAGEAITLSFCAENEPYYKRKITMRGLGILSCNCRFCKQKITTPPLGAMATAAVEILIKDDPRVPPLSMRTEVEIQAREELEKWIDGFVVKRQFIWNACCNDWFMMSNSKRFPGPDLTEYIVESGTFKDKTPKEICIEEVMKLLIDPSAPVEFPVDAVSEIVRVQIMQMYDACKKRWTAYWKEGKRETGLLSSNVEGEALIKMRAYQERRRKAREEWAKRIEAAEKK
ncbi:hypothetical protein BDZ45DRAFT_511371 [Acephala macrosclerotiorum]|nr:hypothetical protein BDZ45DRAFT_511371 [Acephala macrosclerotiorum]